MRRLPRLLPSGARTLYIHPTAAAYCCMAEQLETDIMNKEARYTNPGKPVAGPKKKPRIDLSVERAGWVTGCSAAATRMDVIAPPPSRGHGAGRGPHPRQGAGHQHRGTIPRIRGGSS
jgi:hypothetical protein